ncbi:hypothetical protein M2135_002657 [Parabacteroides sp. PF5-9]|nr:hypothetical protein [Parabacteroides sp. PF5-9]
MAVTQFSDRSEKAIKAVLYGYNPNNYRIGKRGYKNPIT